MQPSPKPNVRPLDHPRETPWPSAVTPTPGQEGRSEWVRGSEGAYLCSRLYVWHCPPRLCFSDLRWVCSPRLFLLLFLMPASQPLSFSSCSSSSTPWPDPVPKDNHVPPALLGTARCGSPSQFSGPQGFCGEAPVASGPLETRFWKAARLWSVRRRSPLLGPQFAQRPRTAHRADLLILVLPLFPPASSQVGAASS